MTRGPEGRLNSLENDFWSELRKSAYGWVSRAPERKTAIAEKYNEAFRGFVPREYSSEELDIARWGAEITLQPHQAAGARRLLAQRGCQRLRFWLGVGASGTVGFALGAFTTYQIACSLRPRR